MNERETFRDNVRSTGFDGHPSGVIGGVFRGFGIVTGNLGVIGSCFGVTGIGDGVTRGVVGGVMVGGGR